MTKEGSTKIVNFMTQGQGFLRISLTIFYSAIKNRLYKSSNKKMVYKHL